MPPCCVALESIARAIGFKSHFRDHPRPDFEASRSRARDDDTGVGLSAWRVHEFMGFGDSWRGSHDPYVYKWVGVLY